MKPRASAGVAAAFTLAVVGVLWWPAAVSIDAVRPITAFADSHVWVFDHILTAPSHPDATSGCRAGYPERLTVRAIGWVPMLVSALFRPLLGVLGSATAVQLLSLPVTAAVTTLAVSRVAKLEDNVLCGILGCAYALCPTLLGTLATGEISNTQAWILPAFLLTPTTSRPALALGVLGVAASFTSPYYALALPVLAGLTWAAQLRGARRPDTLRLPHLIALAIALLPAWAYYGLDAAGGATSLFRPARAGGPLSPVLAHPPPVAQPESLLWHAVPAPGSDHETLHVVALGLALLTVALVGVVRGRGGPGWRTGLAWAIGGAIASLGPWLYAGGQLRGLGSQPLPLPVALLEALGWPTAKGGLYFRYAVIAELGLVLLAARALSEASSRWPLPTRTLAVLLLALHLVEGVAASGPWHERRRAPVAGRSWLEAHADTSADDDDGAVLELPLQGPTDAWFGQSALLRAVYHRRATTALPRSEPRKASPVQQIVRSAFRSTDPAHALRSAGFRLVLLPEEHAARSVPDLRTLRRALGEPEHPRGLYAWDLGPAEPRCLVQSQTR